MNRSDVAVIGSGFAGSILSRVLASQGMKVVLIDAQRHPRFAIGESSTPIADAMLRRIGNRYGLGDLTTMSTWGDWQREHPDLDCGRKRGFSYFAHHLGQRFSESFVGQRSLLAAASASNETSDTHWYRAAVDSYLFDRAVDAGIQAISETSVVAIERSGHSWRLVLSPARLNHIRCDWVIDASGQSAVLARLFKRLDRSDQLRTKTHSIFGHFANVGSFADELRTAPRLGIRQNSSMHELRANLTTTSKDPFDCDDAAQHHLLGCGWMWMLRFGSGICSVGYTTTTDRPLRWPGESDAFPSISSMLAESQLIAPEDGLRRTGRLQRYFDPIIEDRVLMLPTAALTLDPLHSTGIAHALGGVERIAEIILSDSAGDRRRKTGDYRVSFDREAWLLDQLVSTAYAVIDDFPRFTAACMLYFAGAITCEERLQRGETPLALWNADEDDFVQMVKLASKRLCNRGDGDYFEHVRDLILPWNSAGLMNPGIQNRYAYTATK